MEQNVYSTLHLVNFDDFRLMKSLTYEDPRNPKRATEPHLLMARAKAFAK